MAGPMTTRGRTLIVLAVALVAATAASGAVYIALQRAAASTATVPTVVAARTLPTGVRLRPDDVKVVPWPTTCPVPGAIAAVDTAVDRGLVAGVLENEPVTESKLAPPGSGAGLPPAIPSGMRAISLRVDDVVGVAGFVTPGTRVDLVATLDHGPASVARIVVSNVTVAAVGTRQEIESPVVPTRASTVVTLLVTPADAERIALVSAGGRLALALRNPLDVASAPTDGASMASLAAGRPAGATPVLARVPTAETRPERAPVAQQYQIETIRASKRTQETVP